MKSSKYNVFFDHDDQKIGFNSFTKEYIALDPMVYLMYESAFKANNFSEMEDFYKELYDFLIEKGLLDIPMILTPLRQSKVTPLS